MSCSHKNLIIDIVFSKRVKIAIYLLIISHSVPYGVTHTYFASNCQQRFVM